MHLSGRVLAVEVEGQCGRGQVHTHHVLLQRRGEDIERNRRRIGRFPVVHVFCECVETIVVINEVTHCGADKSRAGFMPLTEVRHVDGDCVRALFLSSPHFFRLVAR